MADDQLSTRDLAARSDEADFDSTLDQEEGTEPGAQQHDVLVPDHPADSRGNPEEGDTASAPDHRELEEPARSDVPAVHEPLLPTDQSNRFTDRWQQIQTSFVDQPRDAVADADALVADLMQRLAASFSNERERLEAQWDRGDDVSTEDLRIALTRYRSFFDRLLSA